ncbi:MAG: 3-deoxy-manno-octulosonate cytidylyltransferase [Acidobacteria bacterium]|nr:3-deoxy-manno-octulosonate cytidylyltransferase [Acidobacteriota bacterium]MCI0723087.1 3-deoxy-manno-octulosonate cytidylyltransferase [Acidobacteriota bacterium]
MKSIAIIPARFESTRFPGKPLVTIGQKLMIQHVYERSLQARSVAEVIVATDDARILQAVEAFGGVARMTSPLHRSGTDRVAEVAAQSDADVIVNVQGDEPLIEPQCLDAVVEPFHSDRALMISTLSVDGASEEELCNPNVVKVVVDLSGFALYFSRAPIPFFLGRTRVDGEKRRFYKHVGLYAYRRSFLTGLATLKESFLEKSERLEQLRFLENGYRIKVVNTTYQSLAVDTPEDLERVNAFIRGRAWQPSLSL